MNLYTPDLENLQAVFLNDEVAVNAFIQSISVARFSPYLKVCSGNMRQAIDLYYLNAKLSWALYMNIQIWEVALRNKLNAFLIWKYRANWPFDEVGLLRNLQGHDR